MNNTVIQAEGLSKLYRRGLQVDDGLRHSLEAFLRSPVASLHQSSRVRVCSIIEHQRRESTLIQKIAAELRRPGFRHIPPGFEEG
jgi:hypothetical protein